NGAGLVVRHLDDGDVDARLLGEAFGANGFQQPAQGAELERGDAQVAGSGGSPDRQTETGQCNGSAGEKNAATVHHWGAPWSFFPCCALPCCAKSRRSTM